MDGILQALSLGFLLRSIFAGAFFLISFRVASMGTAGLLTFAPSDLVSMGLPVALFVGVTVYGLHRSLFYPCIELPLNSGWAQATRKKCPLISDRTTSVLYDQWTAGFAEDKRIQEIMGHMAVWADYAHLQYASSFAIGAGLALHRAIAGDSTAQNWLLLFLAALFMLAALISDWRLHGVREKLGIHAS